MALDYDIGAVFLVAILALLGMVLVGNLGQAFRLNRWHPAMIGAAIGALLGVALIEAVPGLT
jgi:hypothetical protein